MNYFFLQEAIAGGFFLIIGLPILLVISIVLSYFLIKKIKQLFSFYYFAKKENTTIDITEKLVGIVALLIVDIFIISLVFKIFTIKYS